jgi:hypothetical protein
VDPRNSSNEAWRLSVWRILAMEGKRSCFCGKNGEEKVAHIDGQILSHVQFNSAVEFAIFDVSAGFGIGEVNLFYGDRTNVTSPLHQHFLSDDGWLELERELRLLYGLAGLLNGQLELLTVACQLDGGWTFIIVTDSRIASIDQVVHYHGGAWLQLIQAFPLLIGQPWQILSSAGDQDAQKDNQRRRRKHRASLIFKSKIAINRKDISAEQSRLNWK